MPKEPYQKLRSHIIWESPWYSLREDQVRFPDGSEGTYTVVDKPGSVYIVPQMANGCLVLIRNYRYTLRKWLWEVPAGGVVPGISLEDMARRELDEEIGGQAGELSHISSFYTMPGIGTEEAHVFLACRVTLGEAHLEPSEAMERHILPLERVVEMIMNNKMTDGISALAILLCLPHLKDS